MHRVAFDLGNWPIYWYGVLIAAGFFAGLWTASRRALRDGIAPETLADLGPWLLAAAIVGARAFYVVSYWDEDFAHQPIWEIFMLRNGGVVFYGGLIGAAIAFLLYTRHKKLPVWPLADTLAPSIALGQGFGRLGCFMNGCCYGCPTSLPWAVRFPADHATHGVPVHPTQLYEATLCLGLYLGLVWLHRHKRFPGQVFAAYLIGYAVLRSVVECFRGDYAVHYLGGIATPAQLVSAAVLTAGLGLWRWQQHRTKIAQA